MSQQNQVVKTKKRYSSDLNDKEWKIIQPLIPPPKTGGRPRTVDIREVMNIIFYVNRTGCQWHMVPHDFTVKASSAYYYYNCWRKESKWEKMHEKFVKRVRKKKGRKEQPSLGIIDSQSVKTTEKGGFADMMQVKRQKAGNDIF